MTSLKTTVRALCIIAFVTGVIDIVHGVSLLIAAGAPLSGVAHDPVLNSQIGFFGAIWFGFGLILWRASSRLREEPELFRLLCGIVALSGLARLGSAIAFGMPGAILNGAMAVELVAGFGLFIWHGSILRRPGLKLA